MNRISVSTVIVLALAFCGVFQTKAQTDVSESQLTVSGRINNFNYVDLGLPSGVKWATCNVGAYTPTDAGKYYAWGETATKQSFDTYSSKTHRVPGLNRISGTRLDVASATLGGTWQLPTSENVQELIDNCSHRFVRIAGVKGMLFTSRRNGNSMFLPAAGFGSPNQGIRLAGESGWYWTGNDMPGSYGATANTAAETLFFNYMNNVEVGNTYRCYGLTVRPVAY